MSAILESLLDDERRAECRVNDGAMAMGRPIIASQLTFDAVQPSSRLHRTIKRVASAPSEHSNAPLGATGELW